MPMFKILLRFVAFLLIPCLMQEPISAYPMLVCPAAVRSVQANSNYFASEVVLPALVGAQFVAPLTALLKRCALIIAAGSLSFGQKRGQTSELGGGETSDAKPAAPAANPKGTIRWVGNLALGSVLDMDHFLAGRLRHPYFVSLRIRFLAWFSHCWMGMEPADAYLVRVRQNVERIQQGILRMLQQMSRRGPHSLDTERGEPFNVHRVAGPGHGTHLHTHFINPITHAEHAGAVLKSNPASEGVFDRSKILVENSRIALLFMEVEWPFFIIAESVSHLERRLAKRLMDRKSRRAFMRAGEHMGQGITSGTDSVYVMHGSKKWDPQTGLYTFPHTLMTFRDLNGLTDSHAAGPISPEAEARSILEAWAFWIYVSYPRHVFGPTILKDGMWPTLFGRLPGDIVRSIALIGPPAGTPDVPNAKMAENAQNLLKRFDSARPMIFYGSKEEFTAFSTEAKKRFFQKIAIRWVPLHFWGSDPLDLFLTLVYDGVRPHLSRPWRLSYSPLYVAHLLRQGA